MLGRTLRWGARGAGLAGSVFERGEAFAGERGFFGAGEVVDQVLQARLGERRLLEIDERERFFVERRRNLVGSRVVGLNLLEFLDRLLQRFGRLVALTGVG